MQLELLLTQGCLQFGDHRLMLRSIDQVVHIVKVALVIEKLFGGPWLEELARDFIRFPLSVMLFPSGRQLSFP